MNRQRDGRRPEGRTRVVTASLVATGVLGFACLNGPNESGDERGIGRSRGGVPGFIPAPTAAAPRAATDAARRTARGGSGGGGGSGPSGAGAGTSVEGVAVAAGRPALTSSGTTSRSPGATDGGPPAEPGERTSNKDAAPRATLYGGGGAVPADVPDAHDDDIVARQLREAATKESDPELRAKLWDEYRRYKNAR